MISAGFGEIAKALILRPLLREKTRTLITVTGIAVGVAVIVAIQLANASALRAFGESVDAIAGRANYQLTSDNGWIAEDELLKLQPLWQAGGRFAPVIDIDGIMLGPEIPIRILAVDLLSDLHFRDYRYARVQTGSGDRSRSVGLFLQLFRDDSVVLPGAFASAHGLKLGSTITIFSRGRRVPFVVRGILESSGPGSAFNGSIAVMDVAAAQNAFALQGRLSRADLLVPPEAEPVLTTVRNALAAGTRLEHPSRRNERVGKMLRAFRINLFALASVALLVGMFLVYNTVLISILRRRSDVGVLKTLGTSPTQIFVAFLLEGAILGVIGSLAGIGLGLLLARGILGTIGRTINSLYLDTAPSEVSLSPGLAVFAVSIGVVVSLLSALQPALEAAGLRPSALIRPGIYQAVTRETTRRLVVAGLIAFALACGTALLPPVGGIPVGGYFAVILVLTGFSLFTPAAIRVMSRLARRPLERAAGSIGLLSAVSLPASLRRVAVATAALSVAIGMMVSVSMMVGSFRETVRVWVAQTVQSDLWLRPARGLSNSPTAAFPEEITDDLAKIPFVEAIDRFRGRGMIYRDTFISVGSGDFDVAATRGELPMIAPRSASKALADAVDKKGVLVSESFALKFDQGVGDVVELPAARGMRRFPITGVYRDYSNDRGVVVMPRPVYIEAFEDRLINTVAVFIRPGTDVNAARAELERRLGPKYGAFGFTNASIRAEVMKIFDQTFMITWALLAVALVVAVLGIINTLTALLMERRREIALLKVLGTSRGQIALMLLLESSLLGLISTILGFVTGTVLSWILINVINKQSFGWTIEFAPPMDVIAISLGITFCVTAVAALVPARLADRVSMAGAMKSE